MDSPRSPHPYIHQVHRPRDEQLRTGGPSGIAGPINLAYAAATSVVASCPPPHPPRLKRRHPVYVRRVRTTTSASPMAVAASPQATAAAPAFSKHRSTAVPPGTHAPSPLDLNLSSARARALRLCEATDEFDRAQCRGACGWPPRRGSRARRGRGAGWWPAP